MYWKRRITNYRTNNLFSQDKIEKFGSVQINLISLFFFRNLRFLSVAHRRRPQKSAHVYDQVDHVVLFVIVSLSFFCHPFQKKPEQFTPYYCPRNHRYDFRAVGVWAEYFGKHGLPIEPASNTNYFHCPRSSRRRPFETKFPRSH